jgi:copper chaperone CopZ
MQLMKFSMAALMTLALSGVATAEDYKVSGVHNCCGACCKAIVKALSSVEGVSDIQAKPKVTDVSFTAADAKTARKAVNKLAAAGFHGKVTGGKKVQMRDNSKVEAGKTEKLTLVGVHNCCPGCAKAVDAAIAKVDGVESHKYTKNKKGVTLTGNFDGQAVVKSLNEAGFHVRKQGARAQGGKKKKAE